MIDTILFDFDGTLVDTNNVIIQSWQHTFRTLEDREEDVDVLVPTFGETLDFTMRKFFPGRPVGEAIEVYRDFQRHNFLDLIEIFPGVADMLEEVKTRGYKTGIVTSRLIGTTMSALEKFNIQGYFDTIITPEETTKHKPDPEPLLVTLDKLGSRPEESALVGDTRFDIGCANNAGALSVLVGWTFALKGVTDFGDHAPDLIIDTPADLLPAISGR